MHVVAVEGDGTQHQERGRRSSGCQGRPGQTKRGQLSATPDVDAVVPARRVAFSAVAAPPPQPPLRYVALRCLRIAALPMFSFFSFLRATPFSMCYPLDRSMVLSPVRHLFSLALRYFPIIGLGSSTFSVCSLSFPLLFLSVPFFNLILSFL